MAEDVAAAAAQAVEWESQRARAIAEIRENRELAAEIRRARQEEQRAEEEHPRPDPDVIAFVAERTGAPGPLTPAELIAKHQLLARGEPQSMRGEVDSGAEYGSAARPSLMIDGREIAPRAVQRSDGWEYELDRQLARARDASLRMTEYLVRTDPEAALALARAKSTRPEGW